MNLSSTLIGALLAAACAGVLWCIADNQSRGAHPFVRPLCPECDEPLPGRCWLPFAGSIHVEACPACGAGPNPWRRRFELLWVAFCILAALRFSEWRPFLETVCFSAVLVTILIVDLRSGLTYIGSLMTGLALALVFAFTAGPEEIVSAIAGAMLGVVVVGLFYVLGNRLIRSTRLFPIQLSDVYLAGVVGSMCRLENLLQALLFALVASIIVAFWLMRDEVPGRAVIPFGPPLALGAIVALLY